jgi:hypothetical protein
MKDLLEELKTNFINPLKFKFFVEKLEEGKQNIIPHPSGAPFNTKESIIDENKTKIFRKLYSEYKKFKVGIPTGMLFY